MGLEKTTIKPWNHPSNKQICIQSQPVAFLKIALSPFKQLNIAHAAPEQPIEASNQVL